MELRRPATERVYIENKKMLGETALYHSSDAWIGLVRLKQRVADAVVMRTS